MPKMRGKADVEAAFWSTSAAHIGSQLAYKKVEPPEKFFLFASREMYASAPQPGRDPERPWVMGSSPAIRTLQAALEDVSSSDVPVLITGERGTGKRALAREIHRRSVHRHAAFHELQTRAGGAGQNGPNGGGVGHNGHGSEAASAFAALMDASRGIGTLYVPDIDLLGRGAQQQLFELLCQRNARQNGSHVSPSARLVCSTTRNLEQACATGAFREDLHYMLSGICLRFPPLRHRKEDIAGLLDEFLAFYAGMFARPKPAISAELGQFCVEHLWPGNVRELEEAARMIVAIGDQNIAVAVLRSIGQQNNDHNGKAGNGTGNGNGSAVNGSYSLKDAGRAASRRAERELILKVLARTRWNRKRAAEELKISYKALLYKLKSIGLDDEVIATEEFNA